MAEVVLHLEINDCIQDCPFGHFDTNVDTGEPIWFCDHMAGVACNSSKLCSADVKFCTPPKNCQLRKTK